MNMKNFKLIYSILFLVVMGTGCTKNEGLDKDLSFLGTAKSSNISKIFDISNDNSGNVKITPLGEGVSSFVVKFGHGSGAAASATVAPGSSATHSYPEGTYTVTIDAYDLAGNVTTTTYPLTVTYRAPENVMINIGSDMTVSATALYAKSFLVYYGDVANETGTPMAIGQTLPAHIYPAGGPYDLKVVALSGGAATTAATQSLFGLPITFESPTVNYFFGTFGDGQGFSTVANPDPTGLNTSAKVGKFVRGFQGWSGTYSPLNVPINFAQGNKIKVLVYNPDPALIGAKLNVELEAAVAGTGATANGVGVLKVPLTTSGAWEELVFDFSTITAIPATARFGQLVLRFNDSSDGAGAVIYVDNFRLTN
jgi:hypothetical protein